MSECYLCSKPIENFSGWLCDSCHLEVNGLPFESEIEEVWSGYSFRHNGIVRTNWDALYREHDTFLEWEDRRERPAKRKRRSLVTKSVVNRLYRDEPVNAWTPPTDGRFNVTPPNVGDLISEIVSVCLHRRIALFPHKHNDGWIVIGCCICRRYAVLRTDGDVQLAVSDFKKFCLENKCLREGDSFTIPLVLLNEMVASQDLGTPIVVTSE